MALLQSAERIGNASKARLGNFRSYLLQRRRSKLNRCEAQDAVLSPWVQMLLMTHLSLDFRLAVRA